MTVLANNPAQITDLELVQKCQQGETYAFRLLYQRYEQKVRGTLYKLCDNQLLDDLQQEVFLKAWKSLPKLRNGEYFSTWLYRICWNVAYDYGKARKLDRTKILNQAQESMQDLARATNHHQTGLLQLHYQDIVQSALQSLSWEHRAVIVLHDLEDMPQKEVAQVLSIPVGTVKSRLFKARKGLRQFLEQQGVNL